MDFLYPLKWIYSLGLYKQAWVVGGGMVLLLTYRFVKQSYSLNPTKKITNELFEPLKAMYHKPIEKKILHADIPRLAPKVFIRKRNGTILEPIEDPVLAVERLFFVLLEETKDYEENCRDDDTIKRKLDIMFAEVRNDNAELSLVLADFLKDNVEIIGPVVLGVLKTISQDMIAPAVIQLKKALLKAPYKDKRGMWFIHIEFGEDSIVINHKKGEESFPTPNSIEYEFQWELSLSFDQNMKELKESVLYISDLEFGSSVPIEQQNMVRSLIHSYVL